VEHLSWIKPSDYRCSESQVSAVRCGIRNRTACCRFHVSAETATNKYVPDGVEFCDNSREVNTDFAGCYTFALLQLAN